MTDFRLVSWQATIGLLLLAAGLASAATGSEPAPHKRHYVFTHYMVCFAAQGERVDDYQREIRQAQAAGIDGFALNCGAWHDEPHYPRRTKAIYQAAQELGTGFKLFFSVDFAGPNRHPPGEFESYVLDMVKTYGRHPSQLRIDGRTVVSTFAGEQGIDWKKDILAPLKAAGYDVFLVPFFYPRPRVTELPDEATVRQHYRKWAEVVDGMFCFGGAGTELQWKSIIEQKPEWVEIVTWNDFSESYVCPVASSARSDDRSVPAWLRSRSSHAGYLELSRYYIEWFKTGRQPPLKDALFWFYRVHPKDTVAEKDRPVKALHGDVQDVLYVTAMTTAPAELRVTSGGTTSVRPLGAGIRHLRIPFSCGGQRFALYRDGRDILSKEGEPIADHIQHYDFFPTSGFAYAP